ncbi:MAG: protein phosphatase 2C domain-containing protein, partial [Symploca sp. SIO2E6]|nr:protein phosphatase 2C domain-containing protein [Symploca sp. SIO2E6]
LLAFIVTPEWLVAMQVGDGFMVVRAEGGDYELLFQPDKGEFANETTPVTASDALQEMQVCLKLIPYKFICVTTDGIENISLVKPENWKPFAQFFRPLEQHMLSTLSLEQKEKKLDDFLHSEKISQSTDDDTTLLLGVYQDSEPSKAEDRGQRAEGTYPDNPSLVGKGIQKLFGFGGKGMIRS